MDRRMSGWMGPWSSTPAGTPQVGGSRGAGGCRAVWLWLQLSPSPTSAFLQVLLSQHGRCRGGKGQTHQQHPLLLGDTGPWAGGFWAPPTLGTGHTAQPAAPLGTPSWQPRPQSTWRPCPQWHRSSCYGDKEGPPRPSADPWLSPRCPCHQAWPHAEPAKLSPKVRVSGTAASTRAGATTRGVPNASTPTPWG